MMNEPQSKLDGKRPPRKPSKEPPSLVLAAMYLLKKMVSVGQAECHDVLGSAWECKLDGGGSQGFWKSLQLRG